MSILDHIDLSQRQLQNPPTDGSVTDVTDIENKNQQRLRKAHQGSTQIKYFELRCGGCNYREVHPISLLLYEDKGDEWVSVLDNWTTTPVRCPLCTGRGW